MELPEITGRERLNNRPYLEQNYLNFVCNKKILTKITKLPSLSPSIFMEKFPWPWTTNVSERHYPNWFRRLNYSKRPSIFLKLISTEQKFLWIFSVTWIYWWIIHMRWMRFIIEVNFIWKQNLDCHYRILKVKQWGSQKQYVRSKKRK